MGFELELDEKSIDEIINEILASCQHLLGFEIVGRLGAGDYGLAFETDQGTVVKITTHELEANLARYILDHPDAHPALPKVYDLQVWTGCHDYDDPIYAIHREALANLPLFPDIPSVQWSDRRVWLSTATSELEHLLGMFPRSEVMDLAVKVLEDRPGLPDDELIFEQMAEFYEWALQHGLTYQDTDIENWGVREDGTVVIRDLGAFHVLSFRRNPDENLL